MYIDSEQKASLKSLGDRIDLGIFLGTFIKSFSLLRPERSIKSTYTMIAIACWFCQSFLKSGGGKICIILDTFKTVYIKSSLKNIKKKSFKLNHFLRIISSYSPNHVFLLICLQVLDIGGLIGLQKIYIPTKITPKIVDLNYHFFRRQS